MAEQNANFTGTSGGAVAESFDIVDIDNLFFWEAYAGEDVDVALTVMEEALARYQDLLTAPQREDIRVLHDHLRTWRDEVYDPNYSEADVARELNTHEIRVLPYSTLQDPPLVERPSPVAGGTGGEDDFADCMVRVESVNRPAFGKWLELQGKFLRDDFPRHVGDDGEVWEVFPTIWVRDQRDMYYCFLTRRYAESLLRAFQIGLKIELEWPESQRASILHQDLFEMFEAKGNNPYPRDPWVRPQDAQD